MSVLLCPHSDLEKEAPADAHMHPPLSKKIPKDNVHRHLPIQAWEELRKRTSWRKQLTFLGVYAQVQTGVL